MLSSLKDGDIDADVTRDDMGTLHVNVCVAIRRLEALRRTLEEKYDFQSEL